VIAGILAALTFATLGAMSAMSIEEPLAAAGDHLAAGVFSAAQISTSRSSNAAGGRQRPASA